MPTNQSSIRLEALGFGGAQRPPKSRHTNRFLKQKPHFGEPDRKNLTAFRKRNNC